MKSKVLLLSLLAIIAAWFLIFNKKSKDTQVKEPEINFIKPVSPKFYKIKFPLICTFERQTIVKVLGDQKPLEGAMGYFYKEVELLDNKEAFLVTKQESPYNQGQNFIVATDCKEVKNVDKYQKEVKDNCMNIYLWDKKTYQMTLQCGYITNEGYLFIK